MPACSGLWRFCWEDSLETIKSEKQDALAMSSQVSGHTDGNTTRPLFLSTSSGGPWCWAMRKPQIKLTYVPILAMGALSGTPLNRVQSGTPPLPLVTIDECKCLDIPFWEFLGVSDLFFSFFFLLLFPPFFFFFFFLLFFVRAGAFVHFEP